VILSIVVAIWLFQCLSQCVTSELMKASAVNRDFFSSDLLCDEGNYTVAEAGELMGRTFTRSATVQGATLSDHRLGRHIDAEKCTGYVGE